MTASFVTSAWSCTVRLVVDDDSVRNAAARDLTDLLERVDRVASRFRPDSELSRANAHSGRPVPVSMLLVDLVDAALQAAADTSGLVDPTIGRALIALGYDRDISEVIAGTTGYAMPPAATARWHDVRLDRRSGLLTVPAGIALDLGATAKAWVADLAANTLSARYGTAVYVELGGDVAVAGERRGGWTINVAERAGAAGEHVTISQGGITTSTTTLRRWQRDGLSVHHIVDPRTGSPAREHWRMATVAAESSYAANIASTAAIVLGPDAVAWLTGRGLAARLVDTTGRVSTTAGWPAQHLDRIAS